MDQSKKTMRHFYCRDVLWETFEQMANDFDCSIDYLINEAMRYYARSKNYQSAMATSQPPPHNMGGPTPGYGGYAPPPGPPQMGQGMPPGPAGMPGQMGQMPAPGTMPPQGGAAAQRRTGAPPPPPMGGPGRGPGPTPAMRGAPGPNSVPGMGPPISGQMNPMANPMPNQMPGAPMPGGPMPGPGGPGPGPMPGGMPPYGGGGGAMPTNASTLYLIYNNQRYPITKDQFIIGRGSKTSDLPIKDGNISRKHAAVIRRNGTYYIKDLGSTNGIDYKGMRIDNKRIDEGDVFHLCDYELRFTYRPD